jgi:hypothetical protein
MRATALVLAVALVLIASGVPSAATASDSGSISRDARGPQPSGDYGPLGNPPTPSLYLLGQTTIFTAGVVLLVVAALLGAYTFISVRRSPPVTTGR